MPKAKEKNALKMLFNNKKLSFTARKIYIKKII